MCGLVAETVSFIVSLRTVSQYQLDPVFDNLWSVLVFHPKFGRPRHTGPDVITLGTHENGIHT